MSRDIVKEALEVAKTYPVFPTNDKKPCWSNAELKVGKGEGGYKIATQDPKQIKKLFSHRLATEIAVPMGDMSGLMCVDVDVYKDPELEEWVKSQIGLEETLTHVTRSGGKHFIFKHPGAMRFPSTLREGVDIKAVGAGYICFPPTAGYKVLNDTSIKSFPMSLLHNATGQQVNGKLATSSFNDATDDDLINRIASATDLYPALRTLSYRLPSRRNDNGDLFSKDEQLAVLKNIMLTSDAKNAGHKRHDDWLDRFNKITDLVESANRKADLQVSQTAIDKITGDGESFFKDAPQRPIGVQREATIDDIEAYVAEAQVDTEYETFNAQGLRLEKLNPIDWVIPGMVPKGSTVSLGGTSNVGKTRWLAALAVSLSVGNTKRMGLPPIDTTHASLWIANEERVDDIKRRLKAVMLQHNDKDSADIVVRGKDNGTARLIALNEIGTPELDQKSIAKIVAQARRVDASVIILDPYVTLSEAMDENSAVSAGILTKAFIMISSMTGAAVIHAHHTPKDRNKDDDWYRGDASAWRGSGAIYSALDCGYTLSHWMPKNGEQRKAWKQKKLELALSRYVVLDTGKIREGEPLQPVMYQLVGQEMDEGEGSAIGVCEMTDEQTAANVLLDGAIDKLFASELAEKMGERLGYGSFTKLAEIHDKMRGEDIWTVTGDRMFTRDAEKLHMMFEDAVHFSGGTVQLVLDTKKKTNGRWTFVIAQAENKFTT